jgi:hypothetical protein
MGKKRTSEGLPLARLFMVTASLSPLFILWAVRGIPKVPDVVTIPFCIGMVIVPNAVLLLRLLFAKRSNDVQVKTVGEAEDHRTHLLVYLFAMLLPLWDAGIDDYRSLAAMIVALVFIIFLFWHLNLYYMNLLFAVLGYRVFSVQPRDETGKVSARGTFVFITMKHSLDPARELNAYRISNHVFWEKESSNE